MQQRAEVDVCREVIDAKHLGIAGPPRIGEAKVGQVDRRSSIRLATNSIRGRVSIAASAITAPDPTSRGGTKSRWLFAQSAFCDVGWIDRWLGSQSKGKGVELSAAVNSIAG